MKQHAILIAERDPFVREVYQQFLKKKGCHVALAQHEGEVLNQLRNNDHPKLLLLDSNLSSTGWQTFVRSIRKEVGESVMIILMVQSVMSVKEQKSIRGIEGFINKRSHSLEGLYKMVEKYVAETK